MSLIECLEKANLPKNQTVLDNFIRAYKIVNNPKYKNILCSISGGSDSDIMLDIISKVDEHNKVQYIWFDTGLEYQATKNQLHYLEKRYGIKIQRERAIKPIPLTCQEYGQPFLSKHTSEMIERLQNYNFKWEDKPFENLVEEYCKEVEPETQYSEYVNGKYYKGCVEALKWWCNKHGKISKNGYEQYSHFDICRNKYLKEFMIANPPTFKISSKCCQYAKKENSHRYIKNNDIDLCIIGVRKAEGGIRATSYKSCYDGDCDDYDKYRPLFWYVEQDKRDYENACNIVHSDCYKVWGFKRTGCCGCPYAKELHHELETTKKYEPKFYKAIMNVFGDSYEYTKQYRQFVQDMKRKEKGRKKLF